MNKKIETAAIEELKALDGEGKALHQIVSLFLKTSEALVEQLNSSLKQNNFGESKKIAHQLKSNAAIVGANELSRLFIELESSCAAGETQSLVELTEKMNGSYQQAHAELTEILKSLKITT